ncbi:MAG: hypothetical protein IIW01_08705 [Thermoguttaceae bacterium]|nr:hypothetical protein [Thermoguttaceae bacterium]
MNNLRAAMADVGTSQDALAGLDRLPTFEQLSGGRSPEAVRQMTGDADWGTASTGAPTPAPTPISASTLAPAPTPISSPISTPISASTLAPAPVPTATPNGYLYR